MSNMMVKEVDWLMVGIDDVLPDKYIDLAAFKHKDQCEYIYFIGDIQAISEYQQAGFTKKFVDECVIARGQGFKYICFYS